MSEYRVAPLAVNEEVSDFIKDLAIGFQRVWLQEEGLCAIVFASVLLKVLRSLPQEILSCAMNSTFTKECVVAYLHKELFPALFLDVFDALLCIESISVYNGWYHWDVGLLALVHVSGLA